jgi:hypothetical protein
MYEKWKKKTRREVGGDGGENEGAAARARYGAGPNVKNNHKAKDELRSADQIRVIKAGKDNMKLKNMKKDQRTKIEAGQRKKKKANLEKYGNAKTNFSGANRRSKLIVKY